MNIRYDPPIKDGLTIRHVGTAVGDADRKDITPNSCPRTEYRTDFKNVLKHLLAKKS
jgi:hypothetical protein